jgi:hypothetical protein
MRQLLVYIASALILLAGSFAYAAVSDRGEGGGESLERSTLQGKGLGYEADWVRLRVQARGLYPGLKRPVRVRVRNRSDNRLTLRSVRPRMRKSGSGCARYVTLERRRFHRLLPPRSTRRIKLRIAMDRTTPDACQGVKLPVRLRARATLR